MRKSMFGDFIVEDVSDDLGEAICEVGEEIHAVVRESEENPGKYEFEVMQNEDGESVAQSEDIFDSFDDARKYLKGWIPDVQRG